MLGPPEMLQHSTQLSSVMACVHERQGVSAFYSVAQQIVRRRPQYIGALSLTLFDFKMRGYRGMDGLADCWLLVSVQRHVARCEWSYDTWKSLGAEIDIQHAHTRPAFERGNTGCHLTESGQN